MQISNAPESQPIQRRCLMRWEFISHSPQPVKQFFSRYAPFQAAEHYGILGISRRAGLSARASLTTSLLTTFPPAKRNRT